ncbi:GGDEF and EAL domain-containing protein [Neptunomonas sp.]|uniref:putative bifunctional diguanylate cyclase/phosphodiesterase n=1 Tax=Neptunomonas sp. TaxID=1971898 RepID=UPI0025F3C045|nr:GGDEF and EAL domain-containing protein [Neptunomonas sp.]
MALNFRHKIAFKQARSVLLISLLLGLISAGGQIFLDYKQEQLHLVSGLDRIILLHKATAVRAIYNLDVTQAKEVTNTLISYPEIYRARLIDDFSEVLAEHSREQAEQTMLSLVGEYFFKVNTLIETDLRVEEQKGQAAKLIIDLDAAYIASNFALRAVTSLSLGLLHNIILACIFLMLFYRYLSKPMMDIAKWVNQLRNSDGETSLPYTEPDEMGDLVSSFASLWQERKVVADQLNDTIQNLSKSEYFSRSLMENAGDAMFLCLLDSTIVQTNNQAVETLGVTRDTLEGRKLADFSQNYSCVGLQNLFISIDAKQASTFEDVQMGKHRRFPIEARCIKLTLQDTGYILILARDITVRKEAERQIYNLAFFDTLTGLANRRLFLDRLTSSLELHQTNHNYGAVLYLDLDRFKTINDSLGHGIGDKLLCEISQRLVRILPGESTCARFGGDEFVVLLPETGNSLEICAEITAGVALKILDEMTVSFDIDGHLLYCTTSVGIAVFPTTESDGALEILRHADTALYRAKALGRNGFQFFDPEMQSSAQERLEIEKGLHQALDNNELELWYQPQVGVEQQIIGAEALLRWLHPEKGIILPGDFISIAEDSGQIIEIGNRVLSQGLQQLSMWVEQGLPKSFRRLAINISPLQFMQVDFVDRVFRLMDETQVPGHMLELEITENMLLNNFDIASNKMKSLKQRGISFAIDDFGTGYSSLKYLRHLPLDVLKIDRSFVKDLTPSSQEAAIVQVIIATADRLDLAVIAEGVETLEERETLLELGCYIFQGYLYSKPVPAAELSCLFQREVNAVEV